MFSFQRIAGVSLALMVFIAAPMDAYEAMTLQKTAEGSAEGVAPPAGLQWIYFAHHTHTDYSDGRDTVRNRILEAASFGADIVSITDHNTIAQCNDPWFIEQDGCIPMRGDEWGGMGRGHACVLNMTGDDPLDVKPGGTLYPLEEMIPAMRARGGTIFINHPFDDGNGWPEGFARAGICGVGAWTTPFPNADARGWWAAHITQGRILVAIGESDHHLEKILSTAISNSLVPCNYVLAASKQPADVQAAVEAGRISIAGSKGAARTFVWCDQNGDGVYETPMGTNIVVTQPKRLRFRVEVYDGAGILGNVMVYSMNGGVKTTLGGGSPWRIDYEADVSAGTKDFVRAELRGTFGVFQSLSNPVYINFAPTVTLTAEPTDPVCGPIEVSAALSAAAADFGADDIVTSNAAVSNFTGGGANYSFTLTPIANGLFSCFVPAERCYDGVGNPNLASATLSRTYETIVEGQPEGAIEGEGGPEGVMEGEVEGAGEGVIEGQPEGEGGPEGALEGESEGVVEGASEGLVEGQPEGGEEGTPEGEASTECGNRLVADPGFELGDLTEQWGVGSTGPLDLMLEQATGDPIDPYEGNYALRFLGRDTDDVHHIGQRVVLDPGLYELSMYIQRENGSVTGILAISLGEAYESVDVATIGGEAVYILERFQFTVDTAGECLLALSNPALTGGNLIIDNVCLTRIENEGEGMPAEGSPEEGEGVLEGQGQFEGSSEGQPEGGEEGLAEGEEGLAEGLVEGQPEGQTEGMIEGEEEGVIEGQAEGGLEGMPEGAVEGIVEGQTEGGEEGMPAEGVPEEGQAEGENNPFHSADQDHDTLISLSELLRVIQFFNYGGFHCDAAGEDGYAPGTGEQACAPHGSDYSPQDWLIGLSELLRLIQFFNSGGYHACEGSEDGFCPGIDR